MKHGKCSEEMYKAQAESAQSNANQQTADNGKTEDNGGDDVQDVDFEEVKD